MCWSSIHPTQSRVPAPSTHVRTLPSGVQMSILSGQSAEVAATQRPSGDNAAAALTEPQSRVLHGGDTFLCQSILPPWMHAGPARPRGPLPGQPPTREIRVAGSGAALGWLI